MAFAPTTTTERHEVKHERSRWPRTTNDFCTRNRIRRNWFAAKSSIETGGQVVFSTVSDAATENSRAKPTVESSAKGPNMLDCRPQSIRNRIEVGSILSLPATSKRARIKHVPMKITSIPQVYRNVNRWGEILTVLSKYGLADWVSRFDLPFAKGLLTKRNGDTQRSRESRIRLALEGLGPAFIKLGQILSTRPDQIGLPLAQELQKLQTEVPADSVEVVRERIEDELGQPVDELFADFNDTPLAAASIGQVHRARLHNGDEVVVKVQRHGIENRVRVDMDILLGLAQFAEKIPELQPYRPYTAATEFQRVLRRELDFSREARNLEQFAKFFADNPKVRIPKLVSHLSTQRVLTMEWLDGVKLSDQALANANQEKLDEIARNGAEIYLAMIFELGLYHADPHPGNLLMMPDGAIGLLDFGMVGRLDEGLRENIEDMLMAIVSQDAEHLASLVMRVGATPTDLDEAALSVDLSDFVSHYGNQPIEAFELAGALTEMMEIVQRYHIALPTGFALLIKVLVMLEGTVQRLEPTFSLMELIQPYQKKMLLRRMSPARQMKKMRRIYSEVEQLAEVLPRRLRDILQQVQSGKFDVHLDHRGLEPSVNRLVLGMLTSALFLGSTVMVTNNVWPLRGVSVPGVLGFAISVGLGLRLLRAISKSGRLDRKE